MTQFSLYCKWRSRKWNQKNQNKVKFYMFDYNSNSHSFASENQHLVAFNNIKTEH